MFRIIRASTIETAGAGSVAHRVILAQVESPLTPLVVWDEYLSRNQPSHRGRGDYYGPREADAAHRRFEQRRDRDGLSEELVVEHLVSGRQLPDELVAWATEREPIYRPDGEVERSR